ECEIAPGSRGNAVCNLKCLDQESAATAHRIERRHVGVPAAEPQYPGSKVFPQRRFSGTLPGAALEQRFAGSVDIQRKSVGFQESVYAHVGLRRVHVGTHAGLCAKPVTNRILDAQSDEVEAVEGTAHRGDVDTYRQRTLEQLRPVDGVDAAIYILFTTIVAGSDLPQNAAGNPAVQIGGVSNLERTRKTCPAFCRGDLARTQPGKFF